MSLTTLSHRQACGFFPCYMPDYDTLSSAKQALLMPMSLPDLSRLFWLRKTITIGGGITYTNNGQSRIITGYVDNDDGQGPQPIYGPGPPAVVNPNAVLSLSTPYVTDPIGYTPAQRTTVEAFFPTFSAPFADSGTDSAGGTYSTTSTLSGTLFNNVDPDALSRFYGSGVTGSTGVPLARNYIAKSASTGQYYFAPSLSISGGQSTTTYAEPPTPAFTIATGPSPTSLSPDSSILDFDLTFTIQVGGNTYTWPNGWVVTAVQAGLNPHVSLSGNISIAVTDFWS